MSKIKNKAAGLGGFTIIEVLMVIAIFSLILAVILLGASELHSAQRDHTRKEYANRVVEAAIDFYKNNGILPFCTDYYPMRCIGAPSEAASFITHYLPEGSDPSSGNSWATKNTHIGTTSFCNPAVMSENDATVYCYSDTATNGYISHNITPKIGQLVLVEDHLCCPCPPGPGHTASVPDDNIQHGHIPTDSSGGFAPKAWDFPERMAILIGTEHGIYCIDNDVSRT